MGAHGLEGYQVGDRYRCQLVLKEDSKYYRVWPEQDSTYYETAKVPTFLRYFKVDSPDN
jgi:hypothetical protein